MSRKSAFIGLVLAIAVGASCNPFDPGGCTLADCRSGLAVQLEGATAASFSVTAVADDGDRRTITCAEGETCRPFFEDFTPSEVTITYESGDRTVERTFTPEYEQFRPNGEDCPPVCLNAAVVLQIGSTS